MELRPPSARCASAITVFASCANALPQRIVTPNISASFFMTASPKFLVFEHVALGRRFYMRWGPGRPYRYFLTASAARQLLERLGVARAGDGYVPGRLLYLRKVCGRKLDAGRSCVVLELLGLARARNGNDPGLARE